MLYEVITFQFLKNMRIFWFNLLFLFSGCWACCPHTNDLKPVEHFTEDWASLAKANSTPDWFRDAKFGIYTHWGPVSAVFEGGKEGQYYDGWHGMFMYCNKGRIDWQTGKPSYNFV